MVSTPSPVNYYESRNLHLIRIRKTGTEAGKRPLDREWQNNPISYTAAREWFKDGGNLGWAIGPNYLVIDIDPRNGGGGSYVKLLEASGLTLENTHQTPNVITGGGGRHVYYKLPPNTSIKQGPLDPLEYPGIDIKTGAGQVVIAGSIHASGLPYTADPKSDWSVPPATIPPALLAVIASLRSNGRPPPPKDGTALTTEEDTSSSHDVQITVEQCASILKHIDPIEHRDYEDWVRHIAAIYHATGGKGLNIAIEWSARDPLYAEAAETQVTRRWKAFGRSHAFPATLRTLIASLPNKPKAQVAGKKARLLIAQHEFDDEKEIFRDLKTRVDALPGGGWQHNLTAIKQILTEAVRLDTFYEEEIVNQLARETKTSKRTINKVITRLKRENREKERFLKQQEKEQERIKTKERKAKERKKKEEEEITFADFIILVRDRVFEKVRAKGQCITRAPNEQYYLYNKTHWKKVGREYIMHLAHKAAHELSTENEEIAFELTAVTDRVERSIRAQNYTDSDQLFFSDTPLSVVNTRNATVWIDTETGEHTVKDHNPGDYLTTVIPVEYQKDATCPSFDTMLTQVFEHIPQSERKDVIRHWWEIVGYVIQPHKNIPLVLLWQGDGYNGKTTIGKFLQNLMGKGCALPTKLHEFGSSRNQHSTASLEGKLLLVDDDLKSDARLSDDVLKKFSETKLVEINPKHKAAYTTQSNLTPLILTNGWPIIRDLSHGLQRRFDVIPFKSNLTKYKDSMLPHVAAKDEMPGILNQALEGLKRLRRRGNFNPPPCLIEAKAEFFKESNNVAAYIQFATAPGGYCYLLPLYSAYVHFCVEHGEGKQIERFGRFKAMLSQLGYEVKGSKVIGISADVATEDK